MKRKQLGKTDIYTRSSSRRIAIATSRKPVTKSKWTRFVDYITKWHKSLGYRSLGTTTLRTRMILTQTMECRCVHWKQHNISANQIISVWFHPTGMLHVGVLEQYSLWRHSIVYMYVLYYNKTHLLFFFFFVCKAARVAVSNTSRTPSFVLAEHSR